MELDGAGPLARKVEALDGAVVEGDVGRLARLARRDREPVVLARDEDAARRALEHRMVGPTVTERELERLVPGRERQQLVTEADPEDRDASNQVAQCHLLGLEG